MSLGRSRPARTPPAHRHDRGRRRTPRNRSIRRSSAPRRRAELPRTSTRRREENATRVRGRRVVHRSRRRTSPRAGDSRLARAILLLVQTGIFLVVVGLLVGALLVDRSGIHGRDYLVFEERAVRSQQLTLAAFVLVIVEFLVGTPLLGAVLAILAILWTVWWLPAEHRRVDVALQTVFYARPQAGAAGTFDISPEHPVHG